MIRISGISISIESSASSDKYTNIPSIRHTCISHDAGAHICHTRPESANLHFHLPFIDFFCSHQIFLTPQCLAPVTPLP
jgi:hypothetical protein